MRSDGRWLGFVPIISEALNFNSPFSTIN